MKTFTIIFIIALFIGTSAQGIANDNSKNQNSSVQKDVNNSDKNKILNDKDPGGENPCISPGDPNCSCVIDIMNPDPEFPWHIFNCVPPFSGFQGCYSATDCNE